MCETSNRPTASRTALCSLIVPALYCTGMSQPPKSMSRAPCSLCTAQSGVRRRSVVSLVTGASYPKPLAQCHVVAHDGAVARSARDLEVSAMRRHQRVDLAEAPAAAPQERHPQLADGGVGAPARLAVGIDVGRDHHVVGPTAELRLDPQIPVLPGQVVAPGREAPPVAQRVAELVEGVHL